MKTLDQLKKNIENNGLINLAPNHELDLACGTESVYDFFRLFYGPKQTEFWFKNIKPTTRPQNLKGLKARFEDFLEKSKRVITNELDISSIKIDAEYKRLKESLDDTVIP